MIWNAPMGKMNNMGMSKINNNMYGNQMNMNNNMYGNQININNNSMNMNMNNMSYGNDKKFRRRKNSKRRRITK